MLRERKHVVFRALSVKEEPQFEPDRAVKDRKHPLYRCSGRTYLCNRLSPSSIRKIAGATELSASRIYQLLNAPEAKEIPVWLSQLRQSSRRSGGKKKAERSEPETEIRSRLAREVDVLRRCTDWLQRLERGENVVVNLRPDEDVETKFVAFDRSRVVRVLERIAADLDNLSLVPNDPHADKESNHRDPRARHREELAEPPPKPKKLSQREQRTALRAALGLPPQ